jgi:predicted transcriptional regulator
MRTVLSVSLPKPLAAELSRLATRTGRTKSDIVKESVGQYLWEARFRAVQRRLSRRAKRSGMVTEDDVFRAIS